MKKISILAFLFAGMLSFSSCDSDRDSNPVLQEPTEFVLNTPAYVNTVYDLANSTSLELTCSQPDYGYTAPTVYAVQVAWDEAFTKSIQLDTKYTTAKMNVDASEIAVAATNLAVAEGIDESQFPLITKLYIRLVAELNSATGTVSSITSNVVELPYVRVEFALPPVKLPQELFLIGEFCGWNWGNAPSMVPVYDNDGTFWRLVYLPEGKGFKFNTATSWDGGEKGYAGATIVDNYEAGVFDDGGNIGVTKGGWYLIVIRSAVKGRDINYTVEINEPAVWLIGGCIKDGGDWTEKLDGWKFTVPTEADADFVSPAFAADVKIEGYDWWKSEFMVFDEVLEYRATQGDLERVTSKAGQKMYINFTKGTGKIE